MKIFRVDFKAKRELAAGGGDVQQRDFIQVQTTLNQKITTHFQDYIAQYPSLQTVNIDRVVDLDKQQLYLPSEFPLAQRAALGLNPLGQLEARMRAGQAHECLQKVRDFLGLRSALLDTKRTHIQGYGATTRSESNIQSVTNLLQRAKDQYNRAYTAMGSLGCLFAIGTEVGPLQELKQEDLKPLSYWTKENDGRYNPEKLSWIWRIHSQTVAGLTNESWAIEGQSLLTEVPRTS